jgi:GT2 family glycosyltransferase
MPREDPPDLSVIIVSYRTPGLVERCLTTLFHEAGNLNLEVFVVDNDSRDETVDRVRTSFPAVRVVSLTRNVGFGAANNVALREATGRYWVLLNSDAFLHPGALQAAIRHMEETPSAGAGGARLLSEDGDWQPSAWQFPSPLNDFLLLSGLAARFPRSRFFNRMTRRWANPLVATQAEWVPGAFMILRPQAMRDIGLLFDEAFFLYYEEVDLCRRLRNAGYQIWYWPDVEVVHLGGESAKRAGAPVQELSASGNQLALWRYRSEWIYYRKHHGVFTAWLARTVELWWHRLRCWRNQLSSLDARRRKAAGSRKSIEQIQQTWFGN